MKIITVIKNCIIQSILVICDPPCQNNAPCVANDTCSCDVGYAGPVCESKELYM